MFICIDVYGADERDENLASKQLKSIQKAPEAEAPGLMVREAGLEPARA